MSPNQAVQLSVILPAFNEGAAVAEAVERHVDGLSKLGIDYEIVIVNDGSNDNTLELAEKEAQRYGGVRVLTNSTNRGHGSVFSKCEQNVGTGCARTVVRTADRFADLGELNDRLSR